MGPDPPLREKAKRFTRGGVLFDPEDLYLQDVTLDSWSR